MTRRRLNHYADVVCHMFMGWRLSDADLELLSEQPDGVLTINLLSGVAMHEASGVLPLLIGQELSAWLVSRSQQDKVPWHEVTEAKLQVIICTSGIATDRKRIVCFDFDCQSLIQTAKRDYVAHVRDPFCWHQRITG